LNKPVVVSEEALVAPVSVPEVARLRAQAARVAGPAYVVLGGISFSHFLNDTMQSLIPSVYPILKESYALDFAQIGMITLAFQFTASLLQPVVGHFTDKKAQPFSLAIGMGFTFFGLLLLSVAQHYLVILAAASLVGLGSAVFHPESARIARLASGGRYGFAQSVFQVGGSFGTSMGPLLAALIVVPFGQPSIAWFSSIAFLAIVILWRIGYWYRPQITARKGRADRCASGCPKLAARHDRAGGAGRAVVLQAALRVEPVELLHLLSDRQVRRLDPGGSTLSVHLPRRERGGRVLRRTAGRSLRPQIRDLVFDPRRAAVHAGAALCRSVDERGADVFIGLIISSATSSIIVFAQELMPHRFGMISGVFFGVAFGIGGLGAAVLGKVADHTGIAFVYQVCAFLPAIGLLAVFLPKLPRTRLTRNARRRRIKLHC
jgi:FSR family fosmidomycin resistance protein-like MFS transporter